MLTGRFPSWALTIPLFGCDDQTQIIITAACAKSNDRSWAAQLLEGTGMKSWANRLMTALLGAVLLAACSSSPERSDPDQDMLDRRDDAIDELDRRTR